MKVLYDPRMVSAEAEVETTRKSALIAADLRSDPVPGVTVTDSIPDPQVELAASLIARYHTPFYVESVARGRPVGSAESNGLTWGPKLAQCATAHVAAMVAAAAEAAEHGRNVAALASGFHHARSERGFGYCTFNGLAVAARWLVDSNPDLRVAILDLDAHCGGGTAEMIAGTGITHVDVALSGYDQHPAATLSNPAWYLADVDRAIKDVLNTHPDIVLANMGVDPTTDFGVSAADLAERDRRVAVSMDAAEVPVALCLAGGYVKGQVTPERLVGLHRATITQFNVCYPADSMTTQESA